MGTLEDEMVHDRITLQSLISILRGKSFTGALIFEEGKVLFMNGSIKLVSYHNDCGEFILDVLCSLPLPPGIHVVELSGSQVKLWLKWQELLHGGEELYISPLPEIDKTSLKRFLDENGLTYLLVETREGV